MTKEELEHEATKYALEIAELEKENAELKEQVKEVTSALATHCQDTQKVIDEYERENAELKKENAAFKETLEFQQSCTMDRYFKLKKAKEIIENLLPFEHVIDPYALTSDIEENKRRFHEPFRKAEEFLKEVEG